MSDTGLTILPASDTAPNETPLPQTQIDLGSEQPAATPTTVVHGTAGVTYTQPSPAATHPQAADYPSDSGIYTKEDAARAAGYSWPEIDAHMGPAQVAAANEGYTPDEINSYLGYLPPDGMVDRNTAAWAQVQHYDPKTLLPSPDGVLDLTANPNWRGDYANALLRGEVRGAQDFADNYAVSALRAGSTGDETMPQVQEQTMAAARGSSQLISQLPSRRDLTDAALSLGEAPFQIARQNLMDHWQDTGQTPLDAAIKAQTNPELRAKLTTQPTMLDLFEQSLKNIAAAARQGVEDVYSSDLAGGAADWGAGGRDPDTFKLLAYIAAKDIDAVARVPAAAVTALAQGGKQYLQEMGMSEGGADDAMRDAIALASFPGFGTHGVEVSPAIQALRRTPVDVIDLAKPPAEAVTRMPLAEATKPIEPATPALRVAARDPDTGQVWTAKPGQVLHADIVDAPAHAEMGFADADGNFLTREQAFNSLKPEQQQGLKVQGALDAADYTLNARTFTEAASPAEKIQALAASAPDDATSFAELAANEDPATQELAKGYDAATAIHQFFTETLPGLFRSESGVVPFGEAPQPTITADGLVARGSRLAFQVAQNAAETLIRKFATGRARAQINYVAEQVEALRSTLAPHMPQWLDSLEAWGKNLPGMAPWDTTIGKLIGHMEGVPGFELVPDGFTPVANKLRELNDWTHRWLQDAADRGVIDPPSYIENYFRHMWENPNAADTAFGIGRQGSGASLKQRTIPTMFDGLREGLTPAEKDPLNLVLKDISGKLRHIAAQDILREAKDLGWLRWGRDAEPGDVRLTGLGAQRNIPIEGGGNRPEYLMAHPGFARVYNNWAGMVDTPLGNIAQMLARMKNTAAGIYLAIPIYHGWTMLKSTIANGYGSMLRDLIHGEGMAALGDFAKSTSIVGKGIEDYRRGQEFQQRYLKFGGMEPGEVSNDPVIQAIVDAGGGASKRTAELYRPGTGPDMITAAMKGSLGSQLRQQWKSVFTTDAMGSPTMNVRAMPQAAMDFVGELVGSASAPLFEHAIPILKDGVNLQAAEDIMRRGAKAGTDPNLLALKIRQAVKNTDDRMGEMTQENLFWPRWGKQLANATMLSTNWVYGTIRQAAAAAGLQLGGRLGTHFAWNETAATNLVGLLMAAGLVNGVYRFFKTGSVSSDPMDYALPRTAGTTRVLLPGEEKEFLDWAKIGVNSISAGMDDGAEAALLAATTGVSDYFTGKEANLWSIINGLRTGREYPNGPRIAYQPGQVHGWLARELLPIFLTNTSKGIPGTSPFERFLTGEREAPKWVEDWKQWRYGRHGQAGLHREWDREGIAKARRDAALQGAQ